MNEGGCDPDGRFYCGSMAYDKQPGAGALYRLDPDGSVHVVLDERHGLERARLEPGRLARLLQRHRHLPRRRLRLRTASRADAAGVRSSRRAGPSGRTDGRRRGRRLGGALERRRRAPLHRRRGARRGGRGAGRRRSPPAPSAARGSTSSSSRRRARGSPPARSRRPARCSAPCPASQACRCGSSPGERAMIERLVLFGATRRPRRPLPAARARRAAGGGTAARRLRGRRRARARTWTTTRSGGSPRERLDEHAADVPAAAREALVRSLRYRPRRRRPTPRASPRVVEPRRGPVAAYLALPPGAVPGGRDGAWRAPGSPAGSRIALEKPFGEDLESAVALNRLLRRGAGTAGEQAVFRVDHVLGMATVQNLLGLRLANPILEAVWDSDHIEQVEILWEETLALEGRAGYYDRAGALKDVVQNHLLQILCLIAMEPPAGLGRARAARSQGRGPALDPAAHALPTWSRADSARPLHRRAGSRPETTFPPTPTRTASTPSARPRPSPSSRSSSTARAGRAPASCCAPARR